MTVPRSVPLNNTSLISPSLLLPGRRRDLFAPRCGAVWSGCAGGGHSGRQGQRHALYRAVQVDSGGNVVCWAVDCL